jgi:NADPH:quinone reductase-like Zn-dependent oxidoreductase
MVFDIIIGLFLAYSIYKIVRRKLCKPNYEGQTVWITGASSGIGEFLAYEFNKHGAEVIISARNEK